MSAAHFGRENAVLREEGKKTRWQIPPAILLTAALVTWGYYSQSTLFYVFGGLMGLTVVADLYVLETDFRRRKKVHSELRGRRRQ